MTSVCVCTRRISSRLYYFTDILGDRPRSVFDVIKRARGRAARVRFAAILCEAFRAIFKGRIRDQY